MTLAEHMALWPVDHSAGHLVATMRRQAVVEAGVGRGGGHHLLGDGVAGEGRPPSGALRFLPHRGPHVGVYGVGTLHRLERIEGVNDRRRAERGDAVELARRRFVPRGLPMRTCMPSNALASASERATLL